MSECRNNERYPEIGRVICPELCALPGILDNISLTGCKIHFPISMVVNLDNEYMIKISLSRSPEDPPLQCMCKPMWVKECANSTQIGLQILYSPDHARLHEFITYLKNLEEKDMPDII